MAPRTSRRPLGVPSRLGRAQIFTNLGDRRQGSQSAYSIFNAGFQALPGQLSSDQLEREIRGGMGAVAAGGQADAAAAGRQQQQRQGVGRVLGHGPVPGDQPAGADAGGGDDDGEDDEDERCVLPRG